MDWLKFFRPHKHAFKFRGRNMFGMYTFECKCGEICTVHPYPFWNGTPANRARIWLWKNA